MIYKYSSLIKVLNILVDFVILNVSYVTASLLYQPEELSFVLDSQQQLNFLLLNLVWFYCSSLESLYCNIITRKADVTIKDSVVALVMFGVIAVALMFGFPQLGFSSRFLTHFILMFSLLILFGKTYFLLLRKSRRRFWGEPRTIVLVGASPAGLDLYRYLRANPHLGYYMEGVFDDTFVPKSEDDPVLLGKVDDCFRYVKAHNICEIYCALPNHEIERIRDIMHKADKLMVRLRLVPDVSIIFDKNVLLEIYGRMPVLSSRQEPLENIVNGLIKRGFDIVFSLFVIVSILSWLTPLIALLIKLESRGPVFFRQLRSGKDNKPFYCLKFRSMRVNAEADQRQTCRGDARITPLGAFLRHTSIDELPQFFNVLVGDMSVVGPRPHMLKHTEDYSLLIDKYMVRHFLTPGITGWAQVNGYRGETKETSSMCKRVDADIWYLENWSFFLDLKIVLLTIWQTVKGNANAY